MVRTAAFSVSANGEIRGGQNLHPAGNIGLDFIKGNLQCRGQFPVQQTLCLLFVALVHYAQPAVQGFGLLLFGIDGHHQLYERQTAVAVHRFLIVLCQSLQRRCPVGLGPNGRDQIDRSICLFPGNHGANGNFGVIHRSVDHAILIERLETIIFFVTVGTRHVRLIDRFHAAYTGGTVYNQISRLKHGISLLKIK